MIISLLFIARYLLGLYKYKNNKIEDVWAYVLKPFWRAFFLFFSFLGCLMFDVVILNIPYLSNYPIGQKSYISLYISAILCMFLVLLIFEYNPNKVKRDETKTLFNKKSFFLYLIITIETIIISNAMIIIWDKGICLLKPNVLEIIPRIYLASFIPYFVVVAIICKLRNIDISISNSFAKFWSILTSISIGVTISILAACFIYQVEIYNGYYCITSNNTSTYYYMVDKDWYIFEEKKDEWTYISDSDAILYEIGVYMQTPENKELVDMPQYYVGSSYQDVPNNVVTPFEETQYYQERYKNKYIKLLKWSDYPKGLLSSWSYEKNIYYLGEPHTISRNIL